MPVSNLASSLNRVRLLPTCGADVSVVNWAEANYPVHVPSIDITGLPVNTYRNHKLLCPDCTSIDI